VKPSAEKEREDPKKQGSTAKPINIEAGK